MKPAALPIAVVILNWNGKALSDACLASWKAARPAPKRLLLVDNGSSDGSVAWLKRRHPGVEFLALPRNLGFAAGNNRGFEALWRKGPPVEAVFICNNDTEVEPAMLGTLWRGLQAHPGWGAAAPRILSHGQGRVWFEGGLIRRNGRSTHLGYGAPDGPAGPAFELPAHGFVTGCGMLVRAGLLRRAGGFDEPLWAYAEDSDLCLRLRQGGHACGVVPAARMSHKVSASFGLGSPQSLYYNTRNSYALLKRHRLGWGLPTRAAFIGINLTLALRALLRGRGAAAAAIVRGLGDALAGRWPLFNANVRRP
jgi:hypothetical protein